MEKMMNSQSAAAVNSANVSISLSYVSSEFRPIRMNITDDTFNGFKLSSDLFKFLAEAISDSKINTFLILEDSTHTNRYCFCFSKDNDGNIVVTEDWSGSDYEYSMGGKKRFTSGNIGYFAEQLYDIISDYYYGIYAVEVVNNAVEVSEAPALEEAPELEAEPCLNDLSLGLGDSYWSETPALDEDNDTTAEGYSVDGLAYAKEHTNGVSMADIIRAVAEEHWNFESVVKESQWTRFTNDSFRDLIWSTCWNEYLMDYTDETLEAETRYIMDFDSVYDDLFDELWPYMSTYDDSCGGCELWVNAWYVVERAAEIIEGSGNRWIDWDEFPDYVMDAFLGDLYGFDTFTERVMSELEGGDIIGIMPYDNGLHLSFVDDEAEVAA